MELRHLRCFLAVAEELHFARAAERLHIDQSPLSRTIKELEEDLGARLFVRTTRSTQLTRAGRLFLEHVRRVFLVLSQARDSVKSVANGFHGQLRIALSDGITPSRLPTLLAQYREEDPEIEIRLFEVPLAQQIKGLHDDLYDAGFSMAEDAGDGIAATPAWEDELMLAVPARHPLLAFKKVPLEEVLRYPLALGDPAICEGHARQVDRFLRKLVQEPLIAQRVATFDVMMTLVSAGLALGLAGEAHIAASREPGVVARRLAGKPPMLTTYLLRRDAEPSEMLARFIERVAFIDSADDLDDAEESRHIR
ncbi:LysR family transcriptional regulator [Acidovorax sp. YS12]|uniref:LysR family transcriptional regulator n=1 Tax=Burkholderia vietnamiensis TaxID=60552 RepID=UPI001CF43E05|nr:LysR family transcriptional regulator [Burkholderia vietnamiensis]MCA8072532.1 LysR family transcriptional regulator [Burkholderia vietnamiensis]UJB65956.1 LysR family transcriptional regulator [Acidovorax sp. YS12]